MELKVIYQVYISNIQISTLDNVDSIKYVSGYLLTMEFMDEIIDYCLGSFARRICVFVILFKD